MNPQFSYLSEEQKKRLHQASLEILEGIGVYLYEEESIALFKKAGAVTESDGKVCIPPRLVEWALSVAPKKIVLHDRNGNPTLFLEPGNVYFGPGSDCLNILDHRTGERRPALSRDMDEIMRVCDALPNIDFLMSAVLPSDVPVDRANHLQMLSMMVNSTKPIMFVTNEFDACTDIVHAAEAAAGGADAHRRKPYCCCYINVTDPLRHNDDSLLKLLHFAENGVPTTYTPMVLRGVNGPVTGAGAIALANAGELVGLVLAQLKREGAPVIHSGGYNDVFDMRSTADVYSGPESYGGRPEMAAYYGLPIFGLGGASDSKLPDGQAAAEAAFTLMMEALAGVNLVHDVGYLESGKCYSLEQLVICDELIGYIRRYLAGIEVNDETLALDLIKELGHHGKYLDTEHTLEHYREDFYPSLFDRDYYEGWMEKGATSLLQRAGKKVQSILAEHKPDLLNDEAKQKISGILNYWNTTENE
jgi:trimethylamine---corrinoid protein Co-methyltransferase